MNWSIWYSAHLKDYATFDVYSFRNYSRFCLRIHFFSTRLLAHHAEQAFVGLSSDLPNLLDELQANYCGFMVIRSQPTAFLAKVALKFPWLNKNSFITPFLREYKVGLFGIPLKVTETIAWSEQDRVVSACSACALSVQFHALKFDKNNPAFPSPAQITKSAHMNSATTNPIFPSSGLTPPMMAMAIRNQGLEPYHINLATWSELKAKPEMAINRLMRMVYAYTRERVTVPILGLNLFTQNKPDSEEYQYDGAHAVTILGYNAWDPTKHDWEKDYENSLQPMQSATSPLKCRSTADLINYLIGHDDQGGPFVVCARTENAQSFRFENNATLHRSLRLPMEGLTHYLDHQTPTSSLSVTKVSKSLTLPVHIRMPDHILLALHPKIRVHLSSIESMIDHFELMLRLLTQKQQQLEPECIKWMNFALWPKPGADPDCDIEDVDSYSPVSQDTPTSDAKSKFPSHLWQIGLYDVNKLKIELREQFLKTNIQPKDTASKPILLESWPLYLWRATAWSGGHRILDIIFDATDARPCNIVKHVVVYWQPLNEWAERILRYTELVRNIPSGSSVSNQAIISHWIEQLTGEQAIALPPMLEEEYGPSCYPNYIKDHEKESAYISSAAHEPLNRCASLPIRTGELVKRLKLELHGPVDICLPYDLEDQDITERPVPKLRKETPYIWLIDHYGSLILGQEVQADTAKPKEKLGHPNLTGGNQARIAGELYWKSLEVGGNHGTWIINNKSGRYTRWIDQRQKKHLINAENRIKKLFPNFHDKASAEQLVHTFLPEVGRELINSEKDLQYELEGYAEWTVDKLEFCGTELGKALYRSGTSAPTAQECWQVATNLSFSGDNIQKKRRHAKIVLLCGFNQWWQELLSSNITLIQQTGHHLRALKDQLIEVYKGEETTPEHADPLIRQQLQLAALSVLIKLAQNDVALRDDITPLVNEFLRKNANSTQTRMTEIRLFKGSTSK